MPGRKDQPLANRDDVPGTAVSVREAGRLDQLAAPLAASTLGEPSGTPAWETIPSWAVIGTADKVIPPALLQSIAQRADGRITDVNAGHRSLISRANTVTRGVLKAANATS